MTQATNFLDFDWVRRVSNVYELQALYITSQSAVVERLSGISEILEDDDPRRMLNIIAERLRVALKIQDSLLEEYGKVLAAEPRHEGARADPDGDRRHPDGDVPLQMAAFPRQTATLPLQMGLIPIDMGEVPIETGASAIQMKAFPSRWGLSPSGRRPSPSR